MRDFHDLIRVWLTLAAGWRWFGGGENRGRRARGRLVQLHGRRRCPGWQPWRQREETGVGFALGPTDLGLNPVWSVRQGREREESRVCPGLGAQWDSSDPLISQVARCRMSSPQADPGSVLSLKCQGGAWLLHTSIIPLGGVASSCLSGSRGLDGVMLPGVGGIGKLRVWRCLWTVFDA